MISLFPLGDLPNSELSLSSCHRDPLFMLVCHALLLRLPHYQRSTPNGMIAILIFLV